MTASWLATSSANACALIAIADGRSTLSGGWWVAFFPGAALALTAVAFNLIGEGLRDDLDPRLRPRDTVTSVAPVSPPLAAPGA